MSDESAYDEVSGDDVPEYDVDDPSGDRQEHLDADEHTNIEDIPDDEVS
jgi:hypothetical protein